jgi:hypothetical protein
MVVAPNPRVQVYIINTQTGQRLVLPVMPAVFLLLVDT